MIGRHLEQPNTEPKPLVETIIAVDKQEHHRLLNRMVFEIQLFQIDRQYQLSGQNGNLADSFIDFQHLVNELHNAAQLEAEKQQDLSQADSIYQSYLQEVDRIYQSLPAYQIDQAYDEKYFSTRRLELATIADFIDEITSELRQKSAIFANEHRQERQVGLLDHNLLQPTVKDAHQPNPLLTGELQEQGINPLNDLLQIHFPPMFMQDDNNISVAKIKDSLTELAKLIVDKYPQVQGVTGTSWLLDNPAICRLIGFKNLGSVSSSDNWDQLINQFGQIHQGRLLQLIKTGQLPMENVVGYVNVIDFLEKFLPANYRGSVNLAKLDPDWAKNYTDFEHNFQLDKKQLSTLLTTDQINNETELRRQFERHATMKMICEQAGVLDSFIELMAQHNFQLDQVKQNNLPEIKAIVDKVDNFIATTTPRKMVNYQVEIN